jgi:hypothetical protein
MGEVINACCALITPKSISWKILEARMSENIVKGLAEMSKL